MHRSLKNRTLRMACLLLILAWGGAAQAQFLLTGNSGGQLMGGLPGTSGVVPLPVAGVFLGGRTPGDAGNFPPLLVPPNPNISTSGTPTRAILQNLATTMGGTIVVPPAALSLPAPGVPVLIAVFDPTRTRVFQVATSISYAWPAIAATLAPGGAPGPTVFGTPGGGVIAYSGGTKAFGGSGQFAITAGPGAVGGRVPPNATGQPPVASVWINFAGALPSTAMTVGVLGVSNPIGLGQAGAPVASPTVTTMFGPVSPGFGAVNIPVGGGGCTMFCMGPAGTITSSAPISVPIASDMVTASKGFPWTTGFITISQPNASPAAIFFLSGTDMRVAGVGNVSLVSGALSVRAVSGPAANRGWLSLTLPEPTAALGGAGALAMLGLCHGLLRRRR